MDNSLSQSNHEHSQALPDATQSNIIYQLQLIVITMVCCMLIVKMGNLVTMVNKPLWLMRLPILNLDKNTDL